MLRSILCWLFAFVFAASSLIANAQDSGGSAASPMLAPALMTAPQSGTAPAAPAAPAQAPLITNVQQTQPGTPAAPAAPSDKAATQPPLANAQTITDFRERNEFQDFITQSIGRTLPIFGQNLFANVPSTFAPMERVPVPIDYVIGPGDELLIRGWGQVDFDVQTTVDRNGQINIPKVGVINLTGIKYGQLSDFLKNSIGRIYRNFELSVTMGQLRAIQILVVGHAKRPGTYTVSSLSTLVNTLFASGGPSGSGSMRRIQLKRGDQVITEFDIYDLLLRGDKSKDVKLLPGDVIYIPPVGPMAAVAGSVNVQAIFELNKEKTLGDLVKLSGGMTTTAAGEIISLERIADRKTRRVAQFPLTPEGLANPVGDGDLVQVLAIRPSFDNAITLRGNVASPARMPWRAGMKIKDLIPEKQALIVADYWIQRNLETRNDINSQGQLRREIKRTLPEVNWDYAVIERLKLDDLTTVLIPFNLGKALEGDVDNNVVLEANDVITIFSKDDIQVPTAKRNKIVRLEGEVGTPGIYQILPGETLRQLVSRIGGLTPNAYLFGAELTRESTRNFQQKRLDEALDRLETDVQRNFSTSAQAAITTDEAATLRAQFQGQMGLVAKLRQLKASGRIVMDIPPNGMPGKHLQDLVLEDGDRFFVPPVTSVVSVAGAVYNPNAFVYRPDKSVKDYLVQAGGPLPSADSSNVYLVRANGEVQSSSQSSAFLGGIQGERLMPGDAIVVPEKLTKFFWSKELREWAEIFYKLSLGVVGLKVLSDL